MQLFAFSEALVELASVGVANFPYLRGFCYSNRRKEDSKMDPILIFLHVLELLLDGKAKEVHPLHMTIFIFVCLCILAIVVFVIWSLSLSAGIPTQ